MSWETERTVYVEKLNSIISGIEQIEGITANRIISDSMRAMLSEKKADAQLLLPKVRDGKFEVAVVGLEKAGKSSFSNALMELNVLPTDDQRCTYTSTSIVADTTDKAVVVFLSEKEFKRSFMEKLSKMEIPDADLLSYNTLTLDQYEKLFDNCPEHIRDKYMDNLNQDIRDIIENAAELSQYIGRPDREFKGDVLTDSVFKGFITEPGKAIAVKEVRLHSSRLEEMPDATIYDVPGFNSPTALHRQQTLEKMRNVDVIIMVAKADEPSITGDVLSIFRESDADGAQLKDKLFVFANKADRATDLQKNIAKTYEEWISKRKIMTERERGRFFFGSANAHLGEAVKNGMIARSALTEQGRTDGIEELRKALKVYYQTERFEVLKKRIDKIIFDVQSEFQKLHDTFDSNTSGDSTRDEIVQLILDLTAELGVKIRPELESLKDANNERIRTQCPLHEEIKDKIDSLITTDNYQITDDDIRQAHRSVAGISGSEQPVKVDTILREERFKIIYSDFGDMVLTVAETEHKNVCSEIVSIFMNGMGVSTSSPHYDVLAEQVKEFCMLDSMDSTSYYESLIERFARDIFEILIKFSHGTDRLNKFKDEAASFLSMGVYYTAAEAAGSKNELSYIDVMPKQSPFWKILLYPETCNLTCSITDVWNTLKDMTGITQGMAGKMLEKTIEKFFRCFGEKAIGILKKELVGYQNRKPDKNAIFTIAEALKDMMEDAESDTLDDVLSGNRYGADIAEKHSAYDYKMVQEEFNDDLNALHEVLVKAFLNAISMDKAFSAKETKLIEAICSSVDLNEKKFRDFIKRNYPYIKAEEMTRINLESDQRNADRAVMNQIDRILAVIK